MLVDVKVILGLQSGAAYNPKSNHRLGSQFTRSIVRWISRRDYATLNLMDPRGFHVFTRLRWAFTLWRKAFVE